MLTRRVRGFLTLVSVGAIGALAWSWGVEAAGGDDDGEHFGFAKRFAGTYVGISAEEGFFGTFTYSSDGTYIGTYSDGDNGDGSFSPEHGVWKQIGRREIATTGLFYGFDADGVLQTILRARGRYSLSRDFEVVQGPWTVDVFLPEQDPLSDDPVATVEGGGESRRLRVMQ